MPSMNPQTRPGELQMSHRSMDKDGITITRNIPITWVLSVIGSILIWAVLQYVSYSKLVDKVELMTLKVTELTTQLSVTSAKNIEQDMFIADIKRRIDLLDATMLSTRLNAVQAAAQTTKGK
jgi:hypothetical protein